MKQKIFTLFLALAASVGTIFALTIDGIAYNLNETERTAEVTSKYPKYSGEVIIPSSVNYNNQTYSVTSIGDWAFQSCTGLTSVTIPNSVTSIGDLAFQRCTDLTSVTIPNSVTWIGDEAFWSCTGLTSVTIGNSVTSIGDYAFSGCSGLTSIEIPNSVTSIGNSAFANCSGLTSIIVVEGNTEYDSRNNCNAIIKTATNTLVAGCKNTIIPNSVTNIGDNAFVVCSDLTSVTIPNSVTSIGGYAFSGCSGLTSIEIPNSVTSIGSNAFSGCTGLTSVTIPNSVTSIGERAFAGCSDLTSPVFNTHVFAYLPTSYEGTYSIPEGIESIAGYALAWCPGLTSVTIPNSVTWIGDGVFYYCYGLTSVTIPNSVTSIGERAFYYCHGLNSVTIPNSVTSIGNEAFAVCFGLKSVTIPNSVTLIGGSAFYGCTGLTSVTCEASTPPACGSDVFYRVDKSIPLYVPFGSVDAYKTADQWKDFTNVLPIQQAEESTVTEIEAKPTENSVVIEWPKVDEATVYTIEIKKNGELICTLTFNELGQLQNIAFAKPARNGGRDSQVRTAIQTTTGWKYTVAGLEPNTTYSYNVIAKRNASDTDNLYDKTITFTTKNTPTDIDAVIGADSQSKQIRNGQLYILRDGKVVNVLGQSVR